MTRIVVLYLQIWRNLCRSSTISVIEEKVREVTEQILHDLGKKNDLWEGISVSNVRFRPNFATPTDIRELENEDSWPLWSSCQIEIKSGTDNKLPLDEFQREFGRLVDCHFRMIPMEEGWDF